MTCHEIGGALIEYGRGSAVGAGTSAAIESHIERCPDCAARLQCEEVLTSGLRAIARASAQHRASAALEPRLMGAFAAQHGKTASVSGGGSVLWLARAAAVLLTGVAVAAVLVSRHGPAPVDKVPGTTRSAAVPAAPADTAPQVASVANPAAATADAPAPRRPRPRGRSPARPSLDDFIALPEAAGLPAFESGRVVRMDVPLDALPSLGFEMVPDWSTRELKADVLVGQDGRARAIRFVNSVNTTEDAPRRER